MFLILRVCHVLKYRRRQFLIYCMALYLIAWMAFAVCYSLQGWETASNNCSERSTTVRTQDHCDTVHIMSVVVGHNGTFGASLLLKSLLAVRHNPLMLHLLVDQDSELVISGMLSSWQIPGVSSRFYQVRDYHHLLSWIPDDDFGNHGLYKILAPHILSGIQKVIILDTGLVFMDDILPVWKRFDAMKASGKLFGMAGFNTGLILADIESLNKAGINWMTFCKKAVSDRLLVSTVLTDYVVFNAIFAEDPSLVMQLPCAWDAQGSRGLVSEPCPTQAISRVRVADIGLHEMMVLISECTNNLNLDCLLANFMARIIEMNGYQLQFPFRVCSENYMASMGKSHLPFDRCSFLRADAARIHRVFPFFFSARLTTSQEYTKSSEESIGIATHLSFDRISQLELLCTSWTGDGSISAALYLRDADVIPLLKKLTSPPLDSCQVHIHLVFRNSALYPTNFMRNVGLKFSKHTHVLILDGDFIPSSNFSTNIDIGLLKRHQHVAIIAPAFETFPSKKPPVDGLIKPALLEYLNLKQVIPFGRKWKNGHAATNYSHWKTASAAYQVHWQAHYEPFVVVRLNKSSSDRNAFQPRFDERFVGYGMNKCSFIIELDALGYKFLVDPNVFVVHFPHAVTDDKVRFFKSPGCILKIAEQFVNELISRHGLKAKKYLSFLENRK